MRSMALASLAVVFGLVSGCGGSDTGSSGDSGGVAVDDLPGKYAEAICQAYLDCAGDLYALFLPGEDCVANTTVTLTEELATLQNAIDAKRVIYRGNQVQACLDEVSGGDCSTLANRQPDVCEQALEGTVAEGDDCTLDVECEGQAYCKLGSTCPGTCAPLEQAGGSCDSDGDCVSGLKCSDTTSRCVAPAQKGDACKGGEPDCVAGFVCLGNDDAMKQPGECVDIATAINGKTGDTCALDTNLCSADYSCEITATMPKISGECVAKVGSGDACHLAIPDECPSDQYCKLPALNPAGEGVCTPKPEASEDCVMGLGDNMICAPGTRCDSGVCRELAHAGEECTANGTCYSGHCLDGACVTGNSCE